MVLSSFISWPYFFSRPGVPYRSSTSLVRTSANTSACTVLRISIACNAIHMFQLRQQHATYKPHPVQPTCLVTIQTNGIATFVAHMSGMGIFNNTDTLGLVGTKGENTSHHFRNQIYFIFLTRMKAERLGHTQCSYMQRIARIRNYYARTFCTRQLSKDCRTWRQLILGRPDPLSECMAFVWGVQIRTLPSLCYTLLHSDITHSLLRYVEIVKCHYNRLVCISVR